MLFNRSIGRGSRVRRTLAIAVTGGLAFIGFTPTSASANFTVPLTNGCPIAGDVNLYDSWHAPRSGGRQHQGIDVGAPVGRELLAVEDGTLIEYDDTEAEGGLGGMNVWLKGSASNVAYYYAHLSAYVPARNQGDSVTKGQVIGYVGYSGNASPTFPHLHFSISTDGSTTEGDHTSVNPYPYLKDHWGCDGAVPSEVGNVTLVPNLNGTLELFYRGGNFEPWATFQTGPNQVNSWSSGHVNLSGSLMGNPVVARNQDGRLQVFYRGGDDQLWTTAQSSANDYDSFTGDHTPLGGQVKPSSEPAAIRNADGRIQVFYRGNDGNIWTTWQTAANGSTWQSGHLKLTATGSTSPVVARNADGRIVLLWTNSGNGLVTRTQGVASVPDSWGSATQLGGTLQNGFVVGTNLTGALEVFYRGGDEQLWHLWQTAPSGAFNSGHAALGGQVVGKPTVARNADGRLEVFYRGEDFKAWQLWQVTPSGGWSGHVTQNGTLTADPSLSVNADGRLQLAYRGGGDSQPWTLYQQTAGGGWSGHIPLGGQVG